MDNSHLTKKFTITTNIDFHKKIIVIISQTVLTVPILRNPVQVKNLYIKNEEMGISVDCCVVCASKRNSGSYFFSTGLEFQFNIIAEPLYIRFVFGSIQHVKSNL